MIDEVPNFHHNYCNFIAENKEPMLIPKILCVFLLIAFTPTWEEDFQDAKLKANDSQKYLVIYFSGSDWCANCYRFKKSVLENTEFNTYAEQNLVLYNADFPRKKKNQLAEEKRNINNELAGKYNKDNIFPKMVMIDSEGTLISEFEGMTFQNGPTDFINQMKLHLSE